MDEEVDERVFPMESWGALSDLFPFDTAVADSVLGQFGVPAQVESEESPESWNNGPSVFDSSDSTYFDALLLSSVDTGMSFPEQVAFGAGVAELGSVDASQVAIGTL